MKAKFIGIFILITGVAGYAAPAAGTATAAKADGLRERYVEGVRLIADAQAAVARTNDVLQLIEGGADGQVAQIADMETQLQQVKRTTDLLKTEAARRLTEGEQLVQGRSRLQARFAALERVLADERALLTGATETAAALITAADKSGNRSDRDLAEALADTLKLRSGQVHRYADQVAQIQLRMKLESTLLDGLQSRAAETTAAISTVTADLDKLTAQVAVQRKAVDGLTGGLMEDRKSLAVRLDRLGQTIESFRVVQLDVLQRWLVDGPPAGDIPALSVTDVIEGNEYAKRPVRPAPGATVLGSADGGLQQRPDGVVESAETIRRPEPDTNELGQVSPEVIRLTKRARWYNDMLSRLTHFSDESLGEARNWANEAEAWRASFAAAGRTLADQSGVLTTVRMQQEMATTSVALISKQAATVRAQVQAEIAQLEQQTKRLEAITAELKTQAGK
ncbi:MAG: hypothetical protein JSS11_17505 [Verrucomicrobia bacterium]|nr:hypothetical protein [Verrucomicrobiota bacterium]